MDKLTKEEAIKKHREMWNWIADETERTNCCTSKFMYFESKNISSKEIPYHYCYCCEYADQRVKGCMYCPIDWGSLANNYFCCDKYKDFDDLGLFIEWSLTYDIKDAIRLARQIANLPEREEIK